MIAIIPLLLLAYSEGISAASFLGDRFSRSELVDRANNVAHFVQEAIKQPYENSFVPRRLQLNDSADLICKVVESAFSDSNDVQCKCMGNVASSFSISCEYLSPICNLSENVRTCGKPQIAVTLMNGRVFSATTCVTGYTRGMLPVEDTCVFVDACPDGEKFCDCTASYGGSICQSCGVCDDGHSISVDCSNVNVEAVAAQCAPVDLDLHLDGGSGRIAGFAPVFSGFCSDIENALDNRIACDCTNASGGNFSLTCESQDDTACLPDQECETVESSVAVVDGMVSSITACSKYGTEESVKVCTSLNLCDKAVCGCSVMYNDQQCASCDLCDGGISTDCSNVEDSAVTKCQAVDKNSAFDFSPNFVVSNNREKFVPDSQSTVLQANQSSSSKTSIVLLCLLPCFFSIMMH